MKKRKLYVYVVLGFILNIFIFPMGGLNILKNVLTSLVNINNDVEVKKVIIESDGYTSKTPGSWHMEKSADWTSPTTAKIVFDVSTNPSFHEMPNFDVVMVVDVSTSMLGTKFDNLQTGAKKYINEILADKNNNISIVEYHSEYSLISPFSNDIDELSAVIDNLTLKCPIESCTNYYAGLLGVEDALENYQVSDNRKIVVLFLTDGEANRETSLIKPQYEYLKSKFPMMRIIGIQYEMGSNINNYLRQVSDIQYYADVDNIYERFFTGTYNEYLNYYEDFELTDFIDTDYFEVLSSKDINVSTGKAYLETDDNNQKVIWKMEPGVLLTGDKIHMEINVKLKDHRIEQGGGFFPTNKKVELTTKLPGEDKKHAESDKTPVLKYGYNVHYDGNYPAECKLHYENDETHYWGETVEFSANPPACDKYKFTGWTIKGEIDKVSDNSFLMPGRDVYIKGTWGKTELLKSTEGTIYVAPPPFLYEVIKEQSIPDNIKSAYVKYDTGVDFTLESSNTNGKGVYTLAETLEDAYPIYYYRGSVDNHVVFANICWRIIRTTDTGGIKLLYNGKPKTQDGKVVCDNSGTAAQVKEDAFNVSYPHSPAYLGYKYGKVYQYYTNRPIEVTLINSISTSKTSNYYYSTSIGYEDETYKLSEDAAQFEWSSNYGNLVGYYTCRNAESTSCTSAYYVVGTSSSYMYYLPLRNGNLLDDVNTNIVLGKSFQDNNDGTYTLKDTVTIKKSDWYSDYSKYSNYYVCRNDMTSDSCLETDINYISSTTSTGYKGFNQIKYGNSFTYNQDTGRYTLTDVIKVFDPTQAMNELSNHHYTCYSNNDTCWRIEYAHFVYEKEKEVYYIDIYDGKGVEDALEEMFRNDNDSTIKKYLENDWYSSNMKNYEKYLEDTEWCNDRSIGRLGGWDPNGGKINTSLIFAAYFRRQNGEPTLSCRKQDTFTVSSGLSKKPIGLITMDEMIYAGSPLPDDYNYSFYLHNYGYDYWTMTPSYYTGYYSSGFRVGNDNSLLCYNVNFLCGVRPVISLKNDTMYSQGTGAKDDPYIVTMN